jgi:hypothetical protein
MKHIQQLMDNLTIVARFIGYRKSGVYDSAAKY